MVLHDLWKSIQYSVGKIILYAHFWVNFQIADYCFCLPVWKWATSAQNGTCYLTRNIPDYHVPWPLVLSFPSYENSAPSTTRHCINNFMLYDTAPDLMPEFFYNNGGWAPHHDASHNWYFVLSYSSGFIFAKILVCFEDKCFKCFI